MKKLAILVGALALTGSTFAQKATTDAPMSLEGQVGFNASTLSWTSPSIRFRYFVSENIAGRLTLGIDNSSTMDNFYENENDNSGGAGTYETKMSSMNIGIGGEYHFAGTDRLSPYGGLDILIGSGKMTTAGDMSDGSSWVDQYSEESEAKVSGFGVNLVAGADYYFAENFYLGLELGLGWSSMTVKEGTSSATFAGTTVSTVSNESKSSSFGNNFISQFRLGWRF